MQELREKTDHELDRLLDTLRNRIREARFRVANKQLPGVREIRVARKTVAQILTLKKERSASQK